jgi:ATP-independent RNA helicase DbpA
VLCPTRELADQVAKEIRRLARSVHNIKVLTLCGGSPFGPQIGSLEHGAHIIVGTPGRIEEHVRKGTLKLANVNMLVLDEADRMLEMGFAPALDAIIEQVPQQRQTLLFSATFPDAIQEVASTHDHSSIEQHFFKVEGKKHRLRALQLLLMHYRPESALVFCNTKRDTQDVADALVAHGFSALALHGDLEQRERDQTLVRFANHSVRVLVATDVAARGLDIDDLDAVINYHIAHDAQIHLHRIGRTGRAGGKGIACSLYGEEDIHRVATVEANVDPILDSEELPPVKLLDQSAPEPAMATLQIDGGKKQKLRAGDILGALTANKALTGKQVGKISLFDHWAFVAVDRDALQTALRTLGSGKLKGRSFRVRHISD